MELVQMCELFSKQALILGAGHWGLFEIMSVQSRDGGKITSVDVEQSEPWVEQTHTLDDVWAFVSSSEIDWVKASIGEAYAIYEQSARTERDWDTFRVTAKLLV